MRVLHKGFNKWEVLRGVLQPVVTHLQFATILPLAVILIVCYPFILSLMQDSRPSVLLHEAQVGPDASIAHIRQAVVVPPVFVSAMDEKIMDIISPLKALSDSLSPDGPKLYSLFNNDTPPISMYVAPRSANVQGLLFTYVYEQESDAEKWDHALQQMCGKQLKQEESNYVDQRELHEAGLATASSAHYSVWPGVNGLAQLIIWLCTAIFLVYTVIWIYSTSLYRPTLVLVTIIVRLFTGIFAALAVVSMLYPAFNTLILSRFLWVILMALYIGVSNSTHVIEAAESTIVNAPTALNRLVNAYYKSFTSFTEIVAVQACLCVLSIVFMYSTDQPTLMPLTSFMITFIAIDIFLHYTNFAAVLYIDFVGHEFHDFVSAGKSTRNKSFIKRTSESGISCFIQAAAHNFDLMLYLPILTYLVLHLKGGYFLNKIHPHITHALTHPKYIDIFMDPLSESLQQYAFLHVFKPAIFEVNGHFEKPSIKLNFTFSTLRYGNIMSVLLEVFCLMIFISSICMIGILLLTDRRHLNFNISGLYAKQLQRFSEYTIDIESSLDIIQLQSEGNWIAALSLSGQLVVIDVSVVGTIPQYTMTLPSLSNPWAVNKVLLNTRDGLVGILCHTSIHVWDIRTGVKIYEFNFAKELSPQPIEVAFVNKTLLMVTTAGKIVEIYTDKPPCVFHLCSAKLRWAVLHQGPVHPKIIICDTENRLYLCKRVITSDGGVQWTTVHSPLSQAYLLLGRHDYPPHIPSFQGMLPQPVPWTTKFEDSDEFLAAVPVPDIQLWIAITDRRALFIDVHSGVILKHMALESYKPGSMRVFHTQPTHCAFCGSIAITSFSVAYESQEREGLLIVETYRIENLSRNNICLRIERDPHETRCRGFNSAVPKRYTVENVISWETTQINMILGIKQANNAYLEGNILNSTNDWEGFAMSSSGGVSLFSIDEQSLDQQLLTGAPGAAQPLGAKSVCVAFGNMIKILNLQSDL